MAEDIARTPEDAEAWREGWRAGHRAATMEVEAAAHDASRAGDRALLHQVVARLREATAPRHHAALPTVARLEAAMQAAVNLIGVPDADMAKHVLEDALK